MSGRTSIIVHPKRTKFIQLHLDYLMICGGGYAEAKTLSIFEHWTNHKLDHRPQARAYNEALEREGYERTQDESVWIYMGVKDLMSALLGEYSKNIANRALQRLVVYGFLESRRNPKLKYDNKLQYRLLHENVQAEIARWDADPEGYPAIRRQELKTLEGMPLSQKRDDPEEGDESHIWDDVIPDMGQVIPDMGQDSPKNGTTIPENTYREPKTENPSISAPSQSSVTGAPQGSRRPYNPAAMEFLANRGIEVAPKEEVEVAGKSVAEESCPIFDIVLDSPEAPVAPEVEVPVLPEASVGPIGQTQSAKKKGKSKSEPKYPPGAMKAMTDAVTQACYPEGGVPKSKGQLIGVKAAELLDAGYAPEDIVQVASFLRRDSWWKDKVTPGALVSEAPRWRSAAKPKGDTGNARADRLYAERKAAPPQDPETLERIQRLQEAQRERQVQFQKR